MLLKLFTPYLIHFSNFFLPFKFLSAASVDLRTQPITAERLCCYAFVGPYNTLSVLY